MQPLQVHLVYSLCILILVWIIALRDMHTIRVSTTMALSFIDSITTLVTHHVHQELKAGLSSPISMPHNFAQMVTATPLANSRPINPNIYPFLYFTPVFLCVYFPCFLCSKELNKCCCLTYQLHKVVLFAWCLRSARHSYDFYPDFASITPTRVHDLIFRYIFSKCFMNKILLEIFILFGVHV